MNIMLLVDNKIEQKQLDSVKSDVSKLYLENAGVTLRFIEERRDFTKLEKEWYDSDSEGIKKSYITVECAAIYKRKEEEVDEVVFLVHRDNWNLTGVWGWNLSRVYSGYGVQQCRFDNRNLANSLGTLYHELMHDHDTFIYTYTGKNIEQTVLVVDWDDDVVHGGRYSGRTNLGWKYIRWKENQSALKAIAPQLKEAITIRRAIWDKKKLGYLQEIYRLAKQLEVLLRQQIASKRKDLAIKTNNTCQH